MPQMTCENLTLGYEGKTVVSGLSFTVNAGDYLFIVGENGSGKSTLMRAILGLKAPISGQITMGDTLTPSEIGYLPQQTASQKDFPATVREVVRSGCLNRCGLRPFYSRDEKQLAEENMKKTGIASLAKHCYRELSGGQQRRALLARALCAARKILLLDEPMSGLDPKATDEIYSLLKELNGDGITIVMISHDIPAAVKYASHMLHMVEQSQRYFGPKEKCLESGVLRMYAGLGGMHG